MLRLREIGMRRRRRLERFNIRCITFFVLVLVLEYSIVRALVVASHSGASQFELLKTSGRVLACRSPAIG